MTPKQLGYYFPAEFAKHASTWLSWPHKEASWPGKIESIFPSYLAFIKTLVRFEHVNINICDEFMKANAVQMLQSADINLSKINFFIHPTNDAWCRDHGPAFLLNKHDTRKRAIVDWDYNAWGNKYPPYHLDDGIPTKIGLAMGLEVFHPGIVMEGGSVDFNGTGTVITSTACLLNPNRNPHLNQSQLEGYLMDYYGQDQVLWVDEGIVGDDTDGHIDDTVRFVSEDTVIAVIEEKKSDENYSLLQKNLNQLQKMRLLNGKQLNIVEIPMPDDVIWQDQRLPASYANFYIANNQVIVPTFCCKKDDQVLSMIQSCFPNREVIGIDSTDLIWGLGSFHCLSQQEPV